MKVGIIGLPNVGKSTLFNTITRAQVLEANYPFATIEPNVGIVDVQDPRLIDISNLFQSKKIVNNQIKFIDIAGLVENASKGEGLGNKFLEHIHNVDALCHVVKCFDNSDIVHVRPYVNPIEEIQIIETELLLADLEQIEKRLAKIHQQKKKGFSLELQQEVQLLHTLQKYLEKDLDLSTLKFSDKELELTRKFNLLSLKPMFYIGNFQDKDLINLPQNLFFQQMMTYSQTKNKKFLHLCILLEKELASLSPQDQYFFLQKYQLTESGIPQMINHSYHLLGLKTYFTAGKTETRAWTFTQGMTAPECARLIHTDLERGFIKAEVFHYQDLIQCQSVAKIKEIGKLRLEGKNYLVQDGDIITFRFNV